MASANAAFPATQLGLQQYLALGVDPAKIVLGALQNAIKGGAGDLIDNQTLP